MIARDGDAVRLELALPVAVATEGVVALFGLIIGALGAAALIALATGSGHTGHGGAANQILTGVLGVVALVGGGWAVRVGVRQARRARAALPRLAATADVITLARPGHPEQHLDRRRVGRAEYRYHRAVLGSPHATSRLTWFDTSDRPLADWTLSPLLGRSVGRWFAAAGIKGDVGRPDRAVRPPVRRS